MKHSAVPSPTRSPPSARPANSKNSPRSRAAGSCPPRSCSRWAWATRRKRARRSTPRGSAGPPAPHCGRAGAKKAGANGASPAGKAVTLALPSLTPAEAEAVTTGALLGAYSFRKYRSTPATDLAISVLTGDGNADAVRRGQVIAKAVNLVRDLVNTSPLDLPPAALAAEAERVAAKAGVAVEVLDEVALRDGGYGGLIGVGQGSTRPPRLVRLSYTHPEATQTVAFVGKGITFDSGGLSLKPPKSMETMKCDMSGAAAVLAATVAAAELSLPVNVVGYLCAAENMPGGAAQRPSDVITIYGGKTVEVLNTDAEGRLVLADGIVRSGRGQPRR